MHAAIDEIAHRRALLETARAQKFPRWKQRLRHRLSPLDYVRTRELPLLLELWSRAFPGEDGQILDLASPQLLACHLARTRPEAKVTYANAFAPEVDDLRVRREALRLSNLSEVVLDARERGACPAESFDAVISASVLEHIQDTPEGWGDAQAIRNAAGWLRPGGILGLSVPFSHTAFDEMRQEACYGGAVAPGESAFFQRFYDEGTLESRLIAPSGMIVVEKAFLGEEFYHPGDIHRRLAARLTGMWKPLLLGWSFPWLSGFCMRRAADWRDLRKPYLAFVILRKP